MPRYPVGARDGSSPHTRGALAECGCFGVDRGIIPAYAGSTVTVTWTLPSSRDHPRIRGEHVPQRVSGDSVGGSSPHTRGALRPAARRMAAGWIIPAYAGSTRFHPPLARRQADHPRIRGEHVYLETHSRQAVGSSPHTRGAQSVHDPGRPAERIIPAYAGSTRRRGSRRR